MLGQAFIMRKYVSLTKIASIVSYLTDFIILLSLLKTLEKSSFKLIGQ